MLIQDNTKHHQQSVLFPLQSFCTQRSQVYLEYETKAQVSVRMVHVQHQCAKLTKNMKMYAILMLILSVHYTVYPKPSQHTIHILPAT